MPVVCTKVRGRKKTQATATAKDYSQSEIIRLVEKAAGGNFEAFGELYGVYLDRIYRYVFYQINNKMAAEDITEEVFLKAWKAIGSCKGKEKTFSSWLYRIAHNQMVNTLRGANKVTSLDKENSVDITDPKQDVAVNMEYQELLETMAGLPTNQRQVLILKFIEGLNNREIGKITGKSEGAIRITQMRALALLKKKLGK